MLVIAYYDALRSDPLMRQLAFWELAGPSAQLEAVSAARGRVMTRWIAQARGLRAPREGEDAPAINAALIAAAQTLAFAEHANGAFSGLALGAGAKRAHAALRAHVRAIYR
ncbi:MAG: hypothetical protein BroJett013_21830 [Alphaproteobacteria bacterium]|nr:MAG: hypothetical protein BroJett013_21830 [Alphaproteobacteria bacterium]